MAIGTYDTYAELYRVISSRNELNEPEHSLELVEPFWCSVKLGTASESTADSTKTASATYTLKTHYLPSVNDTDVIDIDGQKYNVIGHESPFRSSTILTVERTSYDRRV